VQALPAEVGEVVGRYLALVDDRLPGVIEGLYLVGSLALADYRAGQSDIDFVAVSRDPLDDAACDGLRRVHTELRPPLNFDGIYVTYAELAADPAAAQAPSAHEGRFSRSGAFETNPAVWRLLAQRGIPARGPEPRRLAVWSDPQALRRWSLDNLNGYWAGLVARWRAAAPPRELVVHHYGLPWLVLGVARVHHTVVTGDITSKSGGGRWALAHADERWHPVVTTCLALRGGESVELYDRPEAVWTDGLDFAEVSIADALGQGIRAP
jgi:hypothetical protein